MNCVALVYTGVQKENINNYITMYGHIYVLDCHVNNVTQMYSAQDPLREVMPLVVYVVSLSGTFARMYKLC